MIPPHRPYFGVSAIIGATLFPRAEARDLRRCEAAHATANGCAEAVWLPSARSGIAWALRAAIDSDTNVIGPAFTCSVVHEAMVRSGGYPLIIDAHADSFEMERTALRAALNEPGEDWTLVAGEAPRLSSEALAKSKSSARESAQPDSQDACPTTGNHALVLSEPYGHAYDLEALKAPDNTALGAPVSDLVGIDERPETRRIGDRRSATKPKIRIVDSAMAVPHPALFARLRGNDFAVVSFGSGKTVYAGWGAMGFTQDAMLANEVRKIRDSMLVAGSSKLTRKRSLGIGLRTAAQNPLVFSATRKLWYQANALRLRKKSTPPPLPATAKLFAFPATWLDDKTCGAEWRVPSTRVDRGLALRNLKTAEAVQTKRLELARRYRVNLTGSEGLLLPPPSPFALSHYTVRVDGRIRNRLKEELHRRGVYTISLWTFSAYLDPQEFPNAARICAEVINLPLSPWMTVEQVDEVCEQLLRSMAGLTPDS